MCSSNSGCTFGCKKMVVGKSYKMTSLGTAGAVMKCLYSSEKGFILQHQTNMGEYYYDSSHVSRYSEYKEPSFRYFPIWKRNAHSVNMQGHDTRDQAVIVGKKLSVDYSPFIAIGKINQETCEITIEKV